MIYRGTLNAEDRGNGSFETSKNSNLGTQRHITEPNPQYHCYDSLKPRMNNEV